MAFALWFLYVGVIWLNHHGVFRHVARTDIRFNWINLGLLGTTTLVPVATGVEPFELPVLGRRLAFIADPWGNLIELTGTLH